MRRISLSGACIGAAVLFANSVVYADVTPPLVIIEPPQRFPVGAPAPGGGQPLTPFVGAPIPSGGPQTLIVGAPLAIPVTVVPRIIGAPLPYIDLRPELTNVPIPVKP